MSISSEIEDRVRALGCWRFPPVSVRALPGGLSNASFVVDDGAERFVARCGADIPAHHVFRDHEAMVSRAAHDAGLSPELVHAEPGVMVFRFVDGRTWTEEDMRRHPGRIAVMLRRVHTDVARRLTGPARIFWVFHVLRDYMNTLKEGSSRHLPQLPRLIDIADRLEAVQAPMPIVFGHHDFLPGNFIDDGNRLWLIDWEYGAFGTAMFDLANVAANGGYSHDQEAELLEHYFGGRPSTDIVRSFDAMKVASALREAMWAMVSDLHLAREGVDYAAHAVDYLKRTDAALAGYRERHGNP